MIYEIGERFLKSTWAKIALLLVSMLMMFLMFGVAGFNPSKAMLRCRGVDVPKSVSLAQSESFCRCMTSNATFGNIDEKTSQCLERLDNHKNAVRQVFKAD